MTTINVVRMKQFLYYGSLILILCSFGSKSPIGVYTYTNGEFSYKIVLSADSTFKYEFSFSRGTTSSTGKWKLNEDTFYLYDYQKPYTIKEVKESKKDILGKDALIEVVIIDSTANTNTINIRGATGTIFVDGQPLHIAHSLKTNEELVTDLELWVNDNCDSLKFTNERGNVKLINNKINKISFRYDNYWVKNPSNNYFIITLSNYPIFTSPTTLVWEKWLLTKNHLVPLECNKPLSHIRLKK
jgi:hypothetical protein